MSDKNNNNGESEERYPKYRIIYGEGEYDYRFIVVPNPRWDEIQAIVLAGYEKSNDTAVTKAIENMSDVGYEQFLQNRCKEKEIDPCLAMAIITVISSGDPEANGGLFGLGGSGVEEQIRIGIDKLAELEEKYRKGNSLVGWIQSFIKWTDDMNVANKETATYDKDWVGAMQYCGFTASEMSFYPAVMNAYKLIPTKKSSNSQVTSALDEVEFPFKTSQLNNVYFVKGYGTQNWGGGVITAVDGIVLYTTTVEPVYSPVEGSTVVNGNELSITDSRTNIKYVFVGLVDPINSGGEEIRKGQQIGTCKERIIVKCYTPDGSSLDPSTQWKLLQNKLDENMTKSIGQFIEAEARISGTF